MGFLTGALSVERDLQLRVETGDGGIGGEHGYLGSGGADCTGKRPCGRHQLHSAGQAQCPGIRGPQSPYGSERIETNLSERRLERSDDSSEPYGD